MQAVIVSTKKGQIYAGNSDLTDAHAWVPLYQPFYVAKNNIPDYDMELSKNPAHIVDIHDVQKLEVNVFLHACDILRVIPINDAQLSIMNECFLNRKCSIV